MLRILIAAVLLCPQDVPKQQVEQPVRKTVRADVGKSVVELPVKKTVLVPGVRDSADSSKYAVLGLRAAGQVYPVAADPAPGAKYDLTRTGIQWHRGLDAVVHRGKPILLLQILGNFDDVYC